MEARHSQQHLVVSVLFPCSRISSAVLHPSPPPLRLLLGQLTDCNWLCASRLWCFTAATIFLRGIYQAQGASMSCLGCRGVVVLCCVVWPPLLRAPLPQQGGWCFVKAQQQQGHSHRMPPVCGNQMYRAANPHNVLHHKRFGKHHVWSLLGFAL
jgi:hypothetical protein